MENFILNWKQFLQSKRSFTSQIKSEHFDVNFDEDKSTI